VLIETEYNREADDASFDWFKTYEEIKHLINRFVPSKTSRIVMLGCGNSTLSRDLYDDGYKRVDNIDYSDVVIEKMKRVNEEKTEMTWVVGDIRDLPFENESVDVCIDKGTMDALLTGVKDVWVRNLFVCLVSRSARSRADSSDNDRRTLNQKL